jgi:hypothetical protein
LEFQGLGRRKVQAAFDGGHISSDGGALLLRELDTRLQITQRLAACFADHRHPDLIEHSVLELLRQRIYGVALGYEDLNDHDDLMRDPLLALALGKRDAEGENRRRARDKGKALASSSTLNRLELTPPDANGNARYKKIVYNADAIQDLLVDIFLESFRRSPKEIILDFDATDDPIHGEQEGRFFHGYYRCYCYLPLYVTCGDHLLASVLRRSNIDACQGSVELLEYLAGRIHARFPKAKIILRGDSGFARDAIMDFCETYEGGRLYYILGLAKNARLLEHIEEHMNQAQRLHEKNGCASRVFADFLWRTRDSWARERRVIAKAEHLDKGANPRFVVTTLPEDYAEPKTLYENLYCARGDMENRIKEAQLDLFADRTSAHTMRANQLRLWFSSVAYVLLSALRRDALKHTRLARSTCGSIRLKLLKIGAHIKLSVRRFRISLASACPCQDVFAQALSAIRAMPLRC